MRWNENADVSPTLRAGMGSHPPEVFVYDGKGNGGDIVPTITGDHESRVSNVSSVLCIRERCGCAGGAKDC